MNAQEAMKNSQLYGSAIQALVKTFEGGYIPEKDYDRLYEHYLATGLFWQEYAKRLSVTEIRCEMEHNRQCSDRLMATGEYQTFLMTVQS
jgi:hypothetical protein